jgi:hypothetical protein
MSDKTPGQIAYESLKQPNRRQNPWQSLLSADREQWEVAAHAVQKALVERALVETEKVMNERTLVNEDWDMPTLEEADDILNLPKNRKCLTYYDVWLAIHHAAEDRRETCSTGKCIQCRNPHYDGLCECVGEEI